MRTVKPFRLKAARCRIQAERSTTPEVREDFLDLARAWERLAEEHESVFKPGSERKRAAADSHRRR